MLKITSQPGKRKIISACKIEKLKHANENKKKTIRGKNVIIIMKRKGSESKKTLVEML